MTTEGNDSGEGPGGPAPAAPATQQPGGPNPDAEPQVTPKGEAPTPTPDKTPENAQKENANAKAKEQQADRYTQIAKNVGGKLMAAGVLDPATMKKKLEDFLKQASNAENKSSPATTPIGTQPKPNAAGSNPVDKEEKNAEKRAVDKSGLKSVVEKAKEVVAGIVKKEAEGLTQGLKGAAPTPNGPASTAPKPFQTMSTPKPK